MRALPGTANASRTPRWQGTNPARASMSVGSTRHRRRYSCARLSSINVYYQGLGASEQPVDAVAHRVEISIRHIQRAGQIDTALRHIISHGIAAPSLRLAVRISRQATQRKKERP